MSFREAQALIQRLLLAWIRFEAEKTGRRR
jgi:hypothetical protein